MAFQEDLSVFFDPDDFADEAFYDGASEPINGIFDADYLAPEDIEGSAPWFWCAVVDVPSVAHGKQLVINGITYKVRGVQPDGTGVVRLKLEQQ